MAPTDDAPLPSAGGDATPRTVSVVIPVKDDGALLVRCLEALRAQTRPPDEIVVVDNASSDASASVARSAGARVVTCGEPGIPAASAAGYDAALGSLILRLDADCVPPPGWIAEIESAFIADPEVSVLTGSARFIDGPVRMRRPLAALYLHAYTAVSWPALGHRPMFGSNLAMRRETWRAIRRHVHRHDPEVHDDLDLAFHVGERYAVARLGGEPMGISMRPFLSARLFRRRVRRGFRSVWVHWPRDFPPVRWMRLAASRRRVLASEMSA